MYEMDFLHDRLDVDLAIAWIKDLRGIGVEIPKTLSQSDGDYFEPYASGTVGSTKIFKSDGTCEQASVTEPSLWPVPAKVRAPVGLVVMTKDDLSLLSRFLAYHGDVFGFENIYVFDGSTGPQKTYLESISALYSIHVNHSLVDLNAITEELAKWIDEIKEGYEWIFKVDTDEFLVATGGGDGSPEDQSGPGLSNPALLLPAANLSTPALKIQRLYNAAPVESGPPTESERSLSIQAGDFKQFYNGHKFKTNLFNLGSHASSATPVAQGIAFVHYHGRSYEDMVRVATQTIESHGYINASDSKEEMIEKLKKLDQRPRCGFNSCHKAWVVLDDLTKHNETRTRFYAEPKEWPTNLVHFQDYLHKIFAKYPSVVVD